MGWNSLIFSLISGAIRHITKFQRHRGLHYWSNIYNWGDENGGWILIVGDTYRFFIL